VAADGEVPALEQVERLLREGGVRRVPAAEADHEPRSEPRRRRVPVDQGGDQEADGEAAGHVDREGRPREDGFGVALDQESTA